MNRIDDVMHKFCVGSKQYGDFVIIRNDEDIPSERVVLNLVSAALTIAFEAAKNSDRPPIIKRLKTSLKRMNDSDSLPESLRNKEVIGFSARVVLFDANTLSISDYGDCVVLEPKEVAPDPTTMAVLLGKAFQIAEVIQKDGSAIKLSDIKIIIRLLPNELKSGADEKATIGFKCRIISERSLVMDRLFDVSSGEPSDAEIEEGGSSVKA